MQGQGSFQVVKPTQHRLLPFILMLASGYIVVAMGVVGVMGGCVLMNGELTPAYVNHAFWVRTLGHVLFWLWIVPLLIALASVVWAFVGATLRQVSLAAALLLVSLVPYALLISASISGAPMARGTSACGDAM